MRDLLERHLLIQAEAERLGAKCVSWAVNRSWSLHELSLSVYEWFLRRRASR